MTTSSCLIDSNVLIYAVDRSEPAKRARAIAVLKALDESGGSLVSTQSLGEFFRIATGRIRERLPEEEAAGHIREWSRAWPVLGTNVVTLQETLRGRLRYRLSWWDAQQWAIAQVNGVPVVLSEDYTDGRTIEDVTFIDPFAEGFDAGALADG